MTYLPFNNMDQYSEVLTLKATYFGFTSLSTIGLGDFHPRNDSERIFATVTLMFGVGVFSIIMGEYINMLSEYSKFFGDFKDEARLCQFFSALKSFNNKRELNAKLQEEIYTYFYYYWEHNRNMAFKSDEDVEILEQMPQKVRNKIFAEFCYLNFLKVFA